MQDHQDSEEPLLPENDNVDHKLGYNNENLILKFYRPNIETVSMFKIDEESRSRLSLSKHDKISSKGHKRPQKTESASKSARLTNEEKELIRMQKMETFYKERMRPA